ncbi:hypothetical protein RJ640_029878 [Escallonia rubra]|uniref:Peptidase metallopeptidase domain-containing protein n=1 Tax=Escallonia rubra TaxID=112253 RepID=A0AA88RKK8_9ASTE|nr:hypothetical protein RJ640_029878 [Escallonia rubra]
MMLPRCGVADVVKGKNSIPTHNKRKLGIHTVSHYTFFNGMPKWDASKRSLTYRFKSAVEVVGLDDLRSACASAFKRWQDVSVFTFEEAPEGSAGADIEIGFYRGDHGDGFNFDGKFHILAHAFPPENGHFHYDADESWSVNPTGDTEVDLESVAVHEIGHLLGLGHSFDQSAIMFSEISYGAIKRDLQPDDIQGIQALQLHITFRTIMTEFMASKTLYLGLVIILIPSSAFAFKVIVIGFEMPAAISIASISPSSTSTLSSRIRGMNIGLHQFKLYLKKFGYLNYDPSNKNSRADDDEFDELLESALKQYQANYHLKATGKLDSATIKEMMLPRCGVADVVKGKNSIPTHKKRKLGIHTVSHYTFPNGMPKWDASKRSLTYQFKSAVQVVGLDDLRSACASAFKRWQDVSVFTFEEAPEGSAEADIEIGFYRGDHGDGSNFDGKFGTLAHAFSPENGHFHYDADESWSVNPQGDTEADLESVAVHEIGHLLGLGHSFDQSAIMFSEISYGAIKRDLQPDDIQGIQALYS